LTLRERVLASVNPQRLLDLLRQMLRFHSYSASPGELELARWLAHELRGRGLEVSQPGLAGDRVNTLAWLRGSGTGPSLMLNGHIDTNMPGLGWAHDPWAADVEDGYVFGIGCSNMKAADAAMIEAVMAVRQVAPDLKGDVCLAMVVGELQGGVGTLQLLEDGIRTDFFIVGEPTDLALLTLHAGSFEFSIEVTGRTRHMSKMEEAVNAIEKMCRVVDALGTFTFAPTTRPEYGSLQRLNVGSIRGGVGPDAQDWRPPLVPDYCIARVAARFPPGQTAAGMLQEINSELRKLQRQDPDLNFTLRLAPPETKRVMPPFEVARDHPFIHQLAASHRQLAGEDAAMGAIAPYRYYGTDAAHLAQHGMVGVVYGPGGAFNTMADERVAIDDIELAARAYALAIVDTCC
jgi:acetylornithine deacetylase